MSATAVLRYRSRSVDTADVAFIRQLIADHPRLSRRRLSARLCEAWNWVQPNGIPCDMVCRGLMLALHRGGHIELPPPKVKVPNNVVAHRRPARELPLGQEPIVGTLRELGPLTLRQVRRQEGEGLFDQLLANHHYLGYTRPVGEHLKYLVLAGDRPVACLAWSSAPRHLAPRDTFIGWTREERLRGLHLIAYNTRFMVLPWVRVPGLASHVLARVARAISTDWCNLYRHSIELLETFIDPGRFRGSCYRAANWLHLGYSTGRGPRSTSTRPNRSIKELWVYPLRSDFRARLTVHHG
ncbi:MAG: DUF4338 domain-containing protein [Verrucomicrobiae bacterium]|nr:DUF4338 domain-containing protein [Verrucomicrobiae bacterium]